MIKDQTVPIRSYIKLVDIKTNRHWALLRQIISKCATATTGSPVSTWLTSVSEAETSATLFIAVSARPGTVLAYDKLLIGICSMNVG
jgi:hypothetical protein